MALAMRGSMQMKHHLDNSTLLILKQVLNQTLSNVEIVETKMLPATTDDVNYKIIELFNLNKAPKLSKKTVKYYLDTIDSLICFTNKSLLKINSMDIENEKARNPISFSRWVRAIQ